MLQPLRGVIYKYFWLFSHFIVGKLLRLIDSFDTEVSVTKINIIERLSLIEYQLAHRQTMK